MPGTQLTASLTVPYSDPNQIELCPDGALAYAQKVQGNIWQAENKAAVAPVYVDEIDWGDSLESVDMKVGRPVRVELSLYESLPNPMTGYLMVMLANPSSPDEIQGVCATDDPLTELDNGANVFTYQSNEATVYTPSAGLVIQKLSGTDLTWDGTLLRWIGDAGSPLSLSFAGELNVGGKVIYGLSTGGWKPTSDGIYRITYFMPMTSNAQFNELTSIRLPIGTEVSVEEGEIGGGDAIVDWMHNLTYIDITVLPRGGKRP